MKKRFITLLVAILIVFSTVFAGCGTQNNNNSSPEDSSSFEESSSSSAGREPLVAEESSEISYTDLSKDLTADEQAKVDELFYKNNLNNSGADPSVIYVEETGYYYMYSTGLLYQKSKDLINWTTSKSFWEDTSGTWLTGQWTRWAPAVIYDEVSGKYLAFFTSRISSTYRGKYTAMHGETSISLSDYKEDHTCSVCLGVSDSPDGPFKQWTGTVNGGTYASGASFSSYNIGIGDIFLNFERMANANPTNYDYEGFIKVIDVEPFVDPATGDKYLYMCRDLGDSGYKYTQSSILAIKMIDWFTPDYSTVTLVTRCGYENVTDKTPMENSDEGDVNEGPYVIYNADVNKYYLTYSCNGYFDKSYRVKQAVADSPLGPFKKIATEKGGAPLVTETTWPHRAGPGHHTFTTLNGELVMVYHMHQTPNKDFVWPNTNRCIGFDKISWYVNEDGETVMTTNGPSMSYTLYPRGENAYKNIASSGTAWAQTSAGVTIEGAKYLNDGAIKTMAKDGKGELALAFTGSKDRDVISVGIDFSSSVSVKGIQIFNSFSFKNAFDYIQDIKIYYYDQGVLKCSEIGKVEFDWNTYCLNNKNSNDKPVYASGNCASVLFDEIFNVVSIEIRLYPQVRDKINNSLSDVAGVGASEIVVIGKN